MFGDNSARPAINLVFNSPSAICPIAACIAATPVLVLTFISKVAASAVPTASKISYSSLSAGSSLSILVLNSLSPSTLREASRAKTFLVEVAPAIALAASPLASAWRILLISTASG